MKKIVFLLSVISVLSSCDSDDDSGAPTDLMGNWKLTAVLTDPGDGSGTFSAVESDKIITFHQDGSITSNGSLCDLSIEATHPTSGTYSLADLTYHSSDCNNPDHDYHFEQQGTTLIISYPCIEACQAKYEKV